jgi:hypothetical protein
MAWAIPEYSLKEVDWAGRILASQQPDAFDLTNAIEIINNWRSSHYFPLNTLQIGLRRKAHSIYKKYLIAQRIKRLPSIQEKLRILTELKLSKMQDIGGCRAVIGSVRSVLKLVDEYERCHHRHTLLKKSDYINNPKDSGYRSYHLIYAYTSDKKETYNGLRIEIQMRSRLQHYWATAVETVGASTRQALKSSVGESDWLRFFKLMGTVIANIERTAPVPQTPSDPAELKKELRQYVSKLNIIPTLEAFGAATYFGAEFAGKNAKYSLIVLDITNKKVRVERFGGSQLERAFYKYAEVEKSIVGRQDQFAVLASTDTLRQLRRAYPNYFLDTSEFSKVVIQAIR